MYPKTAIIGIKYVKKNKYLIIISGLIFIVGFFFGRNYPDILNQGVIQLKSHSVLITSIATVVLVSATILLAHYNKKLWLAQDRPYLDFRLRPVEENHKIQFNICIKNIGKGPAMDITFKIANTKYFRHSLGSHEEMVLETFETVGATKKCVDGVKDIEYEDINGTKKKQDSIKYVELFRLTTADDGII